MGTYIFFTLTGRSSGNMNFLFRKFFFWHVTVSRDEPVKSAAICTQTGYFYFTPRGAQRPATCPLAPHYHSSPHPLGAADWRLGLWVVAAHWHELEKNFRNKKFIFSKDLPGYVKKYGFPLKIRTLCAVTP